MENEQNKTLQNSNETEARQYVRQMTDGNEKNDTYAKIDDKSDENKQKKERNDRSFSVSLIAKLAILSAMAVVLLYIEFPLLLATPWLKLNVSDVPTLLASFMFGPISGIVVNGVKVGVCLLIRGTSTAFVGDLSNLVSGTLYALVAGIIYMLHRNKKGAIVALAVSSVTFCVAMWVCNQFFLLPLFGMSDPAVLYPALWWTLLFNVIKTTITCLITFFLYKGTHRLFAKF